MIQNLKVTPWDPSGTMTTTLLKKEETPTSFSRGGAEGIVGACARPLIAGCSAGEHRGRASHGYRHSVVCQRTYETWLSSQTQAKPRADEIETATEVPIADPQLRTRLRTKTPPPNEPGSAIPSSTPTPPTRENLEFGELPEARSTSERTMSGQKRTAEEPVGEIE